jgi:hypothetical protein
VRRRLAIAVLHLVFGAFMPAPESDADTDADGAPDSDDVVVDVVLSADNGHRVGRSPHALAAAALTESGADVAFVNAIPDLPREVAESLLRQALAACRTAGTLKIVIGSTPLDPQAVRAIADSLGFQFAGVRRDSGIELYRDLYRRRQ